MTCPNLLKLSGFVENFSLIILVDLPGEAKVLQHFLRNYLSILFVGEYEIFTLLWVFRLTSCLRDVYLFQYRTQIFRTKVYK